MKMIPHGIAVMKHRPSLLAYALLLCLTMGTEALAQSVEEMARRDVEYLCSPQLRGRGYLADGHLAAASYIRDQFRALGLDSLSDGYMQRFSVRLNEQMARPHLRIDGRELRVGHDFLPDERTGSGEITGPVVRAGSGSVIPEKGIDDYAGKDVAGAIVVIDEKSPGGASYNERLRGAVERGARAVIVLADKLTYGEYGRRVTIPVLRALRAAVPEAISMIELSTTSSMWGSITQNVVAMLPGRSVPDSMIILTAHYDHLGSIGDSVYFPGANDNASGVAMLLALARYFREHPLRCSILFIACSGEEVGLVGSRYFVEHPLVDLSRGRFILNMDMAASGREGVMAVGGVDFPEEFELLKGVAATLGIDDMRKRANAPNSDHYFFVESGIRGFYIYPFTGLQPYHSVDDTPATLQWDVFTRLYDLMRLFLEKLG